MKAIFHRLPLGHSQKKQPGSLSVGRIENCNLVPLVLLAQGVSEGISLEFGQLRGLRAVERDAVDDRFQSLFLQRLSNGPIHLPTVS